MDRDSQALSEDHTFWWLCLVRLYPYALQGESNVMDTASIGPTGVGTGCIPRLKSRVLALCFP